MSLLTLILFVAGVVLLISGAELLVRGASRLAVAIGITPLVVGLTIVAFGTSSPELAVSLQAAFSGEPAISIGNVIGSNIFNVLFILGISALVVPLVVSQQLVRLDVPLMITVSVVMFALAADGLLSRVDGALFVVGGIGYTWLLMRISRSETERVKSEYDVAYGQPEGKGRGAWPLQVTLVVCGLALLLVGSRWLVQGAVAIATALGVSQLIIGLTVIAAGTSLPEVATSIVAGLRGERDIAVGNVVGSNLFNIFVVIGFTALLAPAGIEVPTPALNFDLPVMVAASALCIPIFFINHRIDRWQGALFLSYYIFYTLYLILATAQHDALPAFNWLMMYFVLPLTVLTVTFSFLRDLARRSRLGNGAA